MSCDHKLIADNLNDFIEGKLSPELETRCREMIANCSHCAGTWEKANELYLMADRWQDRQVPEWHRVRYAVKPPQREASWVSWAALASSCFAVLLVVFQVEVSMANGLTISFGGSQRELRTEQALAEAIETFRDEQDVLLTTRFADFTEQQDVSTRLMLSEWADINREERRDDLNLVLSAWESQRFQDQRTLDQRFTSLANNQIESDQYINDLMRNVNLQQRGER